MQFRLKQRRAATINQRMVIIRRVPMRTSVQVYAYDNCISRIMMYGWHRMTSKQTGMFETLRIARVRALHTEYGITTNTASSAAHVWLVG